MDSSSSDDGYSETCKSMFDKISKPGLARWYTGCYKNDEDKCFFATDNEKKDDHSPLTEKPDSHFETYPPKEIKEIRFGPSLFDLSFFLRKARNGKQMPPARILALVSFLIQ